ncbi:hypothetical protein HDV00_003727 [Rhizophlyctis rosea]|nr:hypothetical protein HDV00_003727 [Rhizophlyctis rosea]
MVPEAGLDRRFVLLGRQDEIRSRDVLFVPKPTTIHIVQSEGKKREVAWHLKETWTGHCENKALVTSPDTWQFIHSVTQTLLKDAGMDTLSDLLEEIAFNFGMWETKISKDRLALECHAHGHLVLTEIGQRKLVENPIYEKVLTGRHAPAFPYDYDDANELEATRITGDRHDNIFNRMAKLEGNIELIMQHLNIKERS